MMLSCALPQLSIPPTSGHRHAADAARRGIEKFIIRQPPKGEKDDYDSENSWGAPGSQMGSPAAAVEGGTHPRGGSDGTPDDHGNKQNRQAGNAWMLTARTRAARRLPQPRKRFDGSVWGLKDEFTLANFFFLI